MTEAETKKNDDGCQAKHVAKIIGAFPGGNANGTIRIGADGQRIIVALECASGSRSARVEVEDSLHCLARASRIDVQVDGFSVTGGSGEDYWHAQKTEALIVVVRDYIDKAGTDRVDVGLSVFDEEGEDGRYSPAGIMLNLQSVNRKADLPSLDASYAFQELSMDRLSVDFSVEISQGNNFPGIVGFGRFD